MPEIDIHEYRKLKNILNLLQQLENYWKEVSNNICIYSENLFQPINGFYLINVSQTEIIRNIGITI